MTLDPNFSDLVRWFGVPGAMMVVMLAAIAKGTFVTGREHRAILEDKEKQRTDFEHYAQSVKADYEHRLQVVRTDRDYWRETALANMQLAEKSAYATEHAITKIAKLPSGE